MSKYKFGCLNHRWGNFSDFDFYGDDPNTYWTLTHDSARNVFYAFERFSVDGEDFDDEKECSPSDVINILAAMPVDQLPAAAFFYRCKFI